MFREAMRHPRIARLFAHVHVLFWPWLWWQLLRLARWHAANGQPEVLLSVSRWGRLKVLFVARAETPLISFRPLSDFIDRMTGLPADVLERFSTWPPALSARCAAAAHRPGWPGPGALLFDSS